MSIISKHDLVYKILIPAIVYIGIFFLVTIAQPKTDTIYLIPIGLLLVWGVLSLLEPIFKNRNIRFILSFLLLFIIQLFIWFAWRTLLLHIEVGPILSDLSINYQKLIFALLFLVFAFHKKQNN